MPQLDPARSSHLIELADIDRTTAAARHRRATLPEIAVIDKATAQRDQLSGQFVLAQTDVDDLALAARKLDDEIESVRMRAKRDEDLLTAGSIPAKEVENLQKELESLARRQSNLEDDALELMQKREDADAALAGVQEKLNAVTRDYDAAVADRDEHRAAIDTELAELTTRREQATAAIDADVLAIYERLHSAGKTAAGALTGDTCGACHMSLDRASLDEIRSSAPAAVIRCPECSAILVRT